MNKNDGSSLLLNVCKYGSHWNRRRSDFKNSVFHVTDTIRQVKWSSCTGRIQTWRFVAPKQRQLRYCNVDRLPLECDRRALVMLKICTVPHQWRQTKLKSFTTNNPAFLEKVRNFGSTVSIYFNMVRHLWKEDTKFYTPRTVKKKATLNYEIPKTEFKL